MSDRLAISATLSVLMMSIYVLFGTDAARVPLSPDHIAPSVNASPLNVSMPDISIAPGDLMPLPR